MTIKVNNVNAGNRLIYSELCNSHLFVFFFVLQADIPIWIAKKKYFHRKHLNDDTDHFRR